MGASCAAPQKGPSESSEVGTDVYVIAEKLEAHKLYGAAPEPPRWAKREQLARKAALLQELAIIEAEEETREREAKERKEAVEKLARQEGKDGEEKPAVMTTHRKNFKKYVVEGAGAADSCSDADIRDAISEYAGNTTYSEQMNLALRLDSEKELQRFGNSIRLIAEGFRLSRLMRSKDWPLTPFVGVVYRGCHRHVTAEELRNYTVGTIVTWEAFSSTPTKKGAGAAARLPGNVQFEIHSGKAMAAAEKKASKSKSASASRSSSAPASSSHDETVYVPALTSDLLEYNNGEMEMEDVVLYPPYTQFRIVNRKDSGAGTTCIVLETIEFPSLPDLISQDAWDDVKAVLDAHKAAAKTSETKPWFLDTRGLLAQPGQAVATLIAEAVVNTGNFSHKIDGLEALSQLQGLGIALKEPIKISEAHDILRRAGLDDAVQLAKMHPRWYFEAVKDSKDTMQQELSRLHNDKWGQEYTARVAMELEAWYQSSKGSEGVVSKNIQVDKHNKTKAAMNYEVWTENGRMYQKVLPGQNMKGVKREVWRVEVKDEEDSDGQSRGGATRGCTVS